MVAYIRVFDGLATVGAQELFDRTGLRPSRVLSARHGQLLEVERADPAALLKLRIAEDVFLQVGAMRLSGQPADLPALQAARWWRSAVTPALAAWSHVQSKPLTKKLTWRVVVQADDMPWRRYRRSDIVLAAERALMAVGGSWRINREAAPLELWIFQVERQLLVTLRLSTNERRQRGGREVERTAALRPSIAAAMVYLSRPADNDVVLDPMCGSGTLLLERAMAGRYAQLIGGDLDPGAVAAALANFGPRHQPRQIEQWDARQLPLADQSVSVVLCNLPWGRKISETAQLPDLYRQALAQMHRVLRPAGKAILLTSEMKVLEQALPPGAWRPEQTVSRVEVMGRRADLKVLVRR